MIVVFKSSFTGFSVHLNQIITKVWCSKIEPARLARRQTCSDNSFCPHYCTACSLIGWSPGARASIACDGCKALVSAQACGNHKPIAASSPQRENLPRSSRYVCKADLALGCAIVEQNASPPLQQNNARARERRKWYQRRFLLDARSPTPEFSVRTRVRRGQGLAGETLRRENPERGSRPWCLSFRSGGVQTGFQVHPWVAGMNIAMR
jgi:hypothetical protein